LLQVPLAALGQATVAGAAVVVAAAFGAAALVPAVAMLMLPRTTPAISAAITRAVTFLMLIELPPDYAVRALARLLSLASIGGTCEYRVNLGNFRG
jgi:hypothetical protein